MLQCSYILHIMLNTMLMRKLAPHFAPVGMSTLSQIKIVIQRVMIRMSTNQLIMTLIDRIDHFVVTFIHKLNPPIMLVDVFNNLLCSKLCWHNRPGPSDWNTWSCGRRYCKNNMDYTCNQLYRYTILYIRTHTHIYY